MNFLSFNALVRKHIKIIEVIGVIMRIVSFSLVSWMGSQSPFLFVWVFNTIDAAILLWCSTLKRDSAYILLNGFWIVVGLIGVYRVTLGSAGL